MRIAGTIYLRRDLPNSVSVRDGCYYFAFSLNRPRRVGGRKLMNLYNNVFGLYVGGITIDDLFNDHCRLTETRE